MRQLPQCAGVYIVVAPDYRLLYVGQAQDLRQRWSGHHRWRQARGIPGVELAYIPCDPSALMTLERAYIARLRLEWNGQRISCNQVVHPDKSSIAATAGALQDLLGQRLVAVIAGIRDPKAVGRWASGQDVPRDEAAAALQNALAIVELLRTQENDETVVSWFRGMNPDLGDRPPALLVREQPDNVAHAARVFLSL